MKSETVVRLSFYGVIIMGIVAILIATGSIGYKLDGDSFHFILDSLAGLW